MTKYKYIYGPVPSRRLGSSLGVSPIPEKTCNYSCVYCQLGRTDKLINKRDEFFKLEEIVEELNSYDWQNANVDVVTIVGEGEPTLYSRLGELIEETKKITNKTVAVITNGALMYDVNVRNELMHADIVLPSIDAYNDEIFRKIDRPYGKLSFNDITEGLKIFSKEYKGQLMIEIMLVDEMNNSKKDIEGFKRYLTSINYDKLYINTPVRPPAEANIREVNKECIKYAVEELNGISIDMLASGEFFSDIDDSYEAVLSITSRHPMSQFELKGFLSSRKLSDDEINHIYERMTEDNRVQVIDYKGIKTYRSRKEL